MRGGVDDEPLVRPPEVARRPGGPLDLLLVRKLDVPATGAPTPGR